MVGQGGRAGAISGRAARAPPCPSAGTELRGQETFGARGSILTLPHPRPTPPYLTLPHPRYPTYPTFDVDRVVPARDHHARPGELAQARNGFKLGLHGEDGAVVSGDGPAPLAHEVRDERALEQRGEVAVGPAWWVGGWVGGSVGGW